LFNTSAAVPFFTQAWRYPCSVASYSSSGGRRRAVHAVAAVGLAAFTVE